ncbi:MAG TPA: hypothetical protein VGU45_16835 [Microvirga sp.]|jgi:hypothetical protein|nr:hypothetical protein [Microvirga sp.]
MPSNESGSSEPGLEANGSTEPFAVTPADAGQELPTTSPQMPEQVVAEDISPFKDPITHGPVEPYQGGPHKGAWEDLSFEDIVAHQSHEFEESSFFTELAKDPLHLAAVESFTGFTIHTSPTLAGTYRCLLDVDPLKHAISLVAAASGARNSDREQVKVALSRNQLSIRSAFGGAFCECVLPLATTCDDVPLGGCVAFVVLLTDMLMTLDACENKIELTFVADQSRVSVVSGAFARPILTKNFSKFTDITEARIGLIDPKLRQVFDPSALAKACRLLAPYVLDDPVQESFNVVELVNGRLIGGSMSAVGFVYAPALKGRDLRFRGRFLPVLADFMPALDKCYVYDTGKFYVFRDHRFAFGIEKTERRFPAEIAALLSVEKNQDRVLLPRKQLLHMLAGMTASKPIDGVASFIGLKDLHNVHYELTAKGENGRRVRARSTGARQSMIDTAIHAKFSIGALLNTVKEFEAASTLIDFYPGFLVTRESDDQVEMETLISLVKPLKARKPSTKTADEAFEEATL